MGKLTVRAIESAKAKDAPYKLMDGDGLQLRVATDGIKTWLVRYMLDGKERQYRLPKPYGQKTDDGHLSLDDAHHEAAKIRALAKQGIDYQARLAAERRAEAEQQERQQRRHTVRQLFEQWATAELAHRKDQGKETRRGIEKDVMPDMGHRIAADITRADIMAVIDQVTGRGANRLANRLVAELRQMFAFALEREIVTANPTEGISKKKVGGKDTERDRTLSEAEVRALPAALESANMLESTKHAIWVMLATLARIGELTRARIADIDLDAGTWAIPAEHSKNSKPHTIYLSDFAKHHLAALLALTHDDIWLFPAMRTDGALCTKSITKQIYDRQRGIQKSKGTAQTTALCLSGGRWVPHDLRRTGATLMGELGVSGDVIEKCLNHTEENKVKRTYQRAVRESEQRDAWRLLGERLELMTRPGADNVIVMRSA